MQRNALCKSRRELSNDYLLAKIGVDTAENEPLEVWGKIFNIIHWCPYSSPDKTFQRSRGNLERTRWDRGVCSPGGPVASGAAMYGSLGLQIRISAEFTKHNISDYQHMTSLITHIQNDIQDEDQSSREKTRA